MMYIKDIYRWIRILGIRLIALLTAKRELDLPDSILIIAPHPDDETFGCAGLIQCALQKKKIINVIILTGGEGAYPESEIKKEILKEQRYKLALSAADIISLPHENLFFMNLPDGRLLECEHLEEVENIIKNLEPNAIFIPHHLEGWSDHLAVTAITKSIISSLSLNSSRFSSMKIYEYCVWLWYSMPFNKLMKLDWTQSFLLSMDKKEYQYKIKAINKYTSTNSSFGKSYSGNLPKLFIKANKWHKELYFKC